MKKSVIAMASTILRIHHLSEWSKEMEEKDLNDPVFQKK